MSIKKLLSSEYVAPTEPEVPVTPTEFYEYYIDQSLRFNDDDTAYLSRTPAVEGNRTKWTFSTWVKRGNLGITQDIFSCFNVSAISPEFQLLFNSSDQIALGGYTSTSDYTLSTSAVYRDSAAWYHIHFVFDSSNATASERLRLYVNGTRISDFSSIAYPAQNHQGGINRITEHRIGARSSLDESFVDGYLAETHFIDGQSLNATVFGKFKNDVWIPLAYTGTYGTNGFYLDYADGANIGNDVSGNTNNFASYNLTANDIMPDSTTNNYCALIPNSFGGTTQNGNLKFVTSGTAGIGSTYTLTSGKWYFEVLHVSGASAASCVLGLIDPVSGLNQNTVEFNSNDPGVLFSGDGTLFKNTSTFSWVYDQTGLTNINTAGGDIVGVEFDMDSKSVQFYLNNVAWGNAVDVSFMNSAMPMIYGDTVVMNYVANFGQDSSFAGQYSRQGYTDDNGYGDFFYQPPTGALALCSQNLPESATTPNGIATTSTALDYFVDQSLRFNNDSAAYLNNVNSVTGNTKTFTISAWVKYTDQTHLSGSYPLQPIFSAGGDNQGQLTAYLFIGGNTNHEIGFVADYNNTGNIFGVTSVNDVIAGNEWTHIVLSVDTTQATAADRVKMYINGSEVTYNAVNYPSQNFDMPMNSLTYPYYVGRFKHTAYSPSYFDGYMTHVYMVDGQALTPSDFGKLVNNIWAPISYTGDFGTNGFYLDFADPANIGDDSPVVGQTNVEGENTTFDTLPSGYLYNTDTIGYNNGGSFGANGQLYVADYGTPVVDHYGPSMIKTFDIEYGDFDFNISNFNVTNVSGGLGKFVIGIGNVGYFMYNDAWALDSSTSTNASIFFSGFGQGIVWQNFQVGVTGDVRFVRTGDQIQLWQGGVLRTTVTYDAPATSIYVWATAYNTLPQLTWTVDDMTFVGDEYVRPSNNFSVVNLNDYDVVEDSPTENYAVMSPIAGVLSEGNLKITSSSSEVNGINSTLEFTDTNKYVVEVLVPANKNTYLMVGGFPNLTLGWDFRSDTNLIDRVGYNPSYRTSITNWALTTGVITTLLIDLGSNNIDLYVDNVYTDSLDITTVGGGAEFVTKYFVITDGTSVGWTTTVNFGQDSSFSGTKTAQGNTDANGDGDFYYPVPEGYRALTDKDKFNSTTYASTEPSKYFDATTWIGNGGPQSITDYKFDPSLAWIKHRTVGWNHMLFDTIRGAGYSLNTNNTAVEEYLNPEGYLSSFDANGFTLSAGSVHAGEVAYLNEPYVGWAWKASNTTPVINNDGTIQSLVSASPETGFSIVSYTGNATAGATVGHGLSQAPDMILFKLYSTTSSWIVYHESIGANQYLILNSTVAQDGTLAPLNDVAPSSSVITLGGTAQGSNDGSMIAYCFHSVEGFSKIGSYTGNSNADGPFIYCGFRPAYLLIKRATGTVSSWVVYDAARETYNVVDSALIPNTNSAELQPEQAFDFTSNGFKIRSNGVVTNASGETHIYIAFAEMPFKYANAR